MSYLANFAAVLAIVVAVIYYFFKKQYSYWKDRKIPHIPPKSVYGIMKEISEGSHIAYVSKKIYNENKSTAPICGAYLFSTPIILALDLDLIKNIMIKDFQYFVDRGMYVNERDDPLSGHLFSLQGQKWKALRAKLTPTFTSGKMKFMFPTVIEVADRFIQKLNSIAHKQEDIEVKDLLARFTTDVIGTCAFGIECNSLDDPNAKFRKMGVQAFVEKRPIRNFLLQSFRDLGRFFRQKVVDPEVSEFFLKCVEDTVKYREEHKIRRNDFLDLLIELKNLDGEKSISMNDLSAQCFVFFLAGFETSSTLMTFCLYELSFNTEIQERLRQEIAEILDQYDGVLTYEAMLKMEYLDQVLNETLRKYPPVPVLFRITVNDYQIQGTKYILEKGTKVWIPSYAIQHDPKIYPEPEIFDPERFTTENTKQRNIASWTPFGEGPRACIGLRFGMMQARIGMVKILQNYRIISCPKTQKEMKFDQKSPFLISPVGGVYLNFEKII